MDKTAYFNNAATTFPKPEEVYSFVDKFYRESGLNSGRGQKIPQVNSLKIREICCWSCFTVLPKK